MSFEADEEILQDFLVEAGEILEQLSEQLVELENDVDNADLLNAIFRGFHTVKGGAGFLQLTALVDCCHYAENVFDILRNHQRKVDSELMDVVLQALDAVNEMFETVRAGGEPEPADPQIIESLSYYAKPPSDDEEEGDEEYDEEDDIEKSFSFFYDYPGSSQLIGGQKETAHEEIFERLTQDIINATLARW